MSNIEQDISVWDSRLESVIADPESSLIEKDYLDPIRLLKRTAEIYAQRRPRKDGKVGKKVIELATEYTASMNPQPRRTI